MAFDYSVEGAAGVGSTKVRRLAAAALLFSAVLFNFALSIANAHLKSLSSREVIAAELAIVGASFALSVLNRRPAMTPWLILTWLFVIIGLIRWLGIAEIDPKPIRDALIVTVFLCLGIVFGRTSLVPIITSLQIIIVAVMIAEALLQEQYAWLVNIKSYYINTRGFSEDAFWNAGSSFFVSATRPDGRYIFPSLAPPHRFSSVFLEPVSLGNYCILITAFTCAVAKSLRHRTLLFFVASNALLLIGSDGRLAIITSALIILTFWAVHGPKYISITYLPIAVAVAFFFLFGLDFSAGPDDIAGRVAFTAEVLTRFSLWEFLGLANEELVSKVADSGLAYLIATQSIFGVLVLWTFVIFGSSEETYEQTRYKHALCLYIALTLVVSNSLFTIKTASIAWFILGAMQQSGRVFPAIQRGRAGAGLRGMREAV